MIGPYHRAGSWVTVLEAGTRAKVGSMLLSDLQEFEVVDIHATVEPLLQAALSADFVIIAPSRISKRGHGTLARSGEHRAS